MTKQDDPIYCCRCDKVAGYSPQEVWHLCGGYACGNCAEKEQDDEEDNQ